MTNSLIEVRGLRHCYGDGTRSLDGVDFSLGLGETVAIFGPNGSGKTTFVLHLNGLLEGEGEVIICGIPVNKQNLPIVRRKVGLVFQDPDEQLFMPTVLEDAAFGPLNQGMDAAQAIKQAKQFLNLAGMSHAENKAPYHLSEGEKRRVAIAGVLAMQPEILVLDEPTTYLDPCGQRDLAVLLESLPQAKIVVTHNTAFAEAVATRAVFFEKGRIVSEGPPAELVRRHAWSPLFPGRPKPEISR